MSIFLIYFVCLQLPKTYLSDKYGFEKNEVKSIYLIPPYIHNNSNNSANVFDFEKIGPRWKFKYKNETFFVDYLDGQYYDDLQLSEIYDWSLGYLQNNINKQIIGFELYSEDIYKYQNLATEPNDRIKKDQIEEFLDFLIKDYSHDFVIYYSVDDISKYIDDKQKTNEIKNQIKNDINNHFDFDRDILVYITNNEVVIKKEQPNDYDLREGYFMEYKTIKSLKEQNQII
ncbi:MAG: hypothetical protein ACI4XC_05730 [Eubacterium sp.]